MKIILVITGLKMGGAENQVCDLADKLHELGHKVILISLINLVVVEPKNIKVETLNLNIYNIPYCFFKFFIKINSFKPDVVHAHLFHAIMFSRIFRLFGSIPKLISTHHGMKENSFFRRALFSITDSLEDVTTAVSNKAAKSLIGSNSKKLSKIKIIYNGIHLDRFKYSNVKRNEIRNFLKISNKTKLILAVGRLVWEKDYNNLIDSFLLTLKKIPDSRLIIIGDGPKREELTLYAKECNIFSKVIFLGKRTVTNSWYSAADIVVSSSVREGFGLVAVEAMACERIVVATNCGIVDEIDRNLVDVVEPKNPLMLSKAIILSILKDDVTKSMIQKKSLEFVKNNFSMDKIALIWLQIYKT